MTLEELIFLVKFMEFYSKLKKSNDSYARDIPS